MLRGRRVASPDHAANPAAFFNNDWHRRARGCSDSPLFDVIQEVSGTRTHMADDLGHWRKANPNNGLASSGVER
jgi:hypothetical protein